MTVQLNEDLRDAKGKLIGTRVIIVDDNSRQSYADVLFEDAVGISVEKIVAEVAKQVKALVVAKVAVVGKAMAAPVVTAIAKSVGSRK